MAIYKYLGVITCNLFLCFSCFTILACAEIRQDSHPSEWNDINRSSNKFQTTQDTFDWNWIRWDWNKYTLPPPQDESFDYVAKRRHDISDIYFPVFFGVLIFVLLAALFGFLKYYCDKRRRISSNTIYDRLVASDSRPSTPSQRSSVRTISRHITPERPHNILEFSNPVLDSNYIVCTADEPPRYEDVVIGGLGSAENFRETAIPDTPPPEYNENSPPRY